MARHQHAPGTAGAQFLHVRTQERARNLRGEEEPGGVEHLELYRSRLPGTGGSLAESPVHDAHSHTADAARTFAEAWSHGLLHGPGDERPRRGGLKCGEGKGKEAFFC